MRRTKERASALKRQMCFSHEQPIRGQYHGLLLSWRYTRFPSPSTRRGADRCTRFREQVNCKWRKCYTITRNYFPRILHITWHAHTSCRQLVDVAAADMGLHGGLRGCNMRLGGNNLVVMVSYTLPSASDLAGGKLASAVLRFLLARREEVNIRSQCHVKYIQHVFMDELQLHRSCRRRHQP